MILVKRIFLSTIYYKPALLCKHLFRMLFSGFLGYSSAFGMSCMLMFTFTVVAKKFEIPCPLENTTISHETHSNTSVEVVDTEEEQFCEPEMFSFSLKVIKSIIKKLFINFFNIILNIL